MLVLIDRSTEASLDHDRRAEPLEEECVDWMGIACSSSFVGDGVACFFRGSYHQQCLLVTKLSAQRSAGAGRMIKLCSHSLVSTYRFAVAPSVIWENVFVQEQPKSSLWMLCYDDTLDQLSVVGWEIRHDSEATQARSKG